MRTQGVTITGVVERMLDHTANGRWRALEDVLDDQFEIVDRTRCRTAEPITASVAIGR